MKATQMKVREVEHHLASFYDGQWSSDQGSKDTTLFLALMGRAIPYSYALLGEITGESILEIGCGSGQQTAHLARRGAKVIAIDFSQESIASLRKLIREQHLPGVTPMSMDAEQMDFEDGSFDAIYINSLLMHVNAEKVLSSCSRMLKPGGVVVIVEPLKYHPLALLYRVFSGYSSTAPRYMTLRRFRELQGSFRTFAHREFSLLALLPAAVRWMLKMPRGGGWLLHVGEAVDDALLRAVPALGNFCWVSVVRYGK